MSDWLCIILGLRNLFVLAEGCMRDQEEPAARDGGAAAGPGSAAGKGRLFLHSVPAAGHWYEALLCFLACAASAALLP